MKVWLLLVLLLTVLSCEAGKKKKKGTSSSSSLYSLKNRFLRRRPIATKPPPVTVPVKKVDLQKIDFKSFNTTDQFYKAFKLPRLKEHGHKTGDIDHSTALQEDSKWGCRFRPTLIHLPAPAYGNGFIFPSCATVNRCSGCCGVSNLGCKPVAVDKVQVDYYHVQPDGSYTITSTQVDEHLGCACQCSQTADSCLKTQYFNPGLCQCECLPQNQEYAMDCPLKGNFQFDPKTCSCVCKTIRHCDDPNLQWSDEDCTCVCKKKECPSRQYLDETCQCVSETLGQRQ